MSAYWDAVNSIAEEAREEYPDPERDRDERSQWITESVDGSEWIIYYAKNEIVLNETDNEPDDDEVASMGGEGKGWKDLRQLAAFMAMERDIHQQVQELDKKAEGEAEEEPEGATRYKRKRWPKRK